MISELLRNIILISLMCTSVAILTLVLKKLIGKSSGAWWRSIVWVLLLLRLCVPVQIQSPIGVMNNFSVMETANQSPVTQSNEQSAPVTQPAVAYNEELSVNEAEANHISQENIVSVPDSFDWLSLVNYAYIAGLIISAAMFLIRIAALNKRMSKLKMLRDKNILYLLNEIKKQMGIKRKISVLIGPNDNTPALAGMFIPNIIIPESALSSTNAAELEYIFIHELTHYKRRDVMKLWLLELAACIHWFNPILHLIKSVIVQDFELACDEGVLSFINNSEYADYSKTLVNFSTKKRQRQPLVVTSNFAGKNGQNLRERLVMIKMFNRKKIITFGIILVMILSAVLVSCTSVIREDEAEAGDSVRVKYLDYYYTDIPGRYLEPFAAEFGKIEAVMSDEAFTEDMYGDFKYRVIIDSEGCMLYRDKDDGSKFYLVYTKGKDEPWEYFTFISEEFNAFLSGVEKDVLEYGELIKYDKDKYEEVYALINGEMTLDEIKSSEHWTFYEREDYYLLRAIFPDENEYHVTLSSDGRLNGRYLDYDKDKIEVYNADKDEYIQNPTIERFVEFTEMKAPKPSEAIEAEETEEAEAPQGYDINAGNGHIIKTLIEIVENQRPIGDLTEEFNMQHDGAAYRLSLFTSTDEYEIELIDGGVAIDSMLDYSLSQLNIFNITDGWTLNNPDSEDISVLMLDEYYTQREDWREDNAESRYSGNFITIASPAGQIKIDLTPEAAERISAGLKSAENKIIINDFKGTEKEFHMKGLEIYLEEMGYEYPVPLWINDEGTKAIGFANEPIPASGAVYDMISAIAQEQATYEEGNIKDIHDLVSVELIVEGLSQGIVTDDGSVKAIETMLSGSEIMNGIGGCPFGAKLKMTRADGHVIEAVIPTDSCGYFILGTATCYQYDRADSSDNRKYTQEDLLKHFGMTDFFWANNESNYKFTDEDIESAKNVIESYFKARLDKDAEAFVALTHPARDITMERVAAGEYVIWEEAEITLLEIKPYDAQTQRRFSYSKDCNDGLTIIFKVEFDVKFPNGYKSSPYDEGVYSDWAMILTRYELGGQWYVYDQGY